MDLMLMHNTILDESLSAGLPVLSIIWLDAHIHAHECIFPIGNCITFCPHQMNAPGIPSGAYSVIAFSADGLLSVLARIGCSSRLSCPGATTGC